MTKEEKAKAAHDIWAHWMKYMFTKCKYFEMPDDYASSRVLTIPSELVERWQRQMNTPFEELSEQEQKSDYKIAEQFLK